MPRKLELTWFEPRKSWKKRITINGKQRTFYFKFGKSKSDRDGYRQALESWHQKRQELERERAANKQYRAEYDEAIRKRQALARWCRENDEPEQGDVFKHEADELAIRFASSDVPLPLSFEESNPLSGLANEDVPDLSELELADALNLLQPMGVHMYAEEMVWMDRAQRLDQTAGEKTVGFHADHFISLKRCDVPESLSPGRWDVLARSVRAFRDWIGPETPVSKIGAQALQRFRTFLLELTKLPKGDGGIGRKTANDRLKDVRQFLRWCWETNVIDELPRNINSRDLTIHYEIPKIVTFTFDEVRNLLEGADDRMRLFLLLAMNCAMLPQDISELGQDEVDWKTGRVQRKRSKTRRHGSANENGSTPVVDYQLWEQTFVLLKKFRSDDKKRVLLNANGHPLKQSSIGDDGKINNTSNVAKQYERLRQRLGVQNPKPFKTFRATGASKLEEHDIHGRYAQYYLGQSPRSVADKHYVRPSEAQFDKALAWLGKQFDVT
jgi:integrase